MIVFKEFPRSCTERTAARGVCPQTCLTPIAGFCSQSRIYFVCCFVQAQGSWALFKTALQVGETCQFDQNKCREAQPIEVLTITAPETFNFQAVVVVFMGWHVLAVWNTEPVSVWLSTFILQRFATTLDRWLLNDFWLDSMVLGCFSAYGLEWCPCIPPNKSGYRSPVTSSMFSIKQSEGIFIIWWPFLALRLGSPAGFAVN